MNQSQFAALLGFFFIFAWALTGLGDALLCLAGAALFYAAAAYYRGELDLNDLRQRVPRQRR